LASQFDTLIAQEYRDHVEPDTMAHAEFRLNPEIDWSSLSDNQDRGVTVILRTKDRPIFLRRALSSIVAQDYADMTLCLINDGGDRQIVEAIVRSCVPQGLDHEIIHHAQSLGQPAALNAGLARVGREFFAIHDDDDSWSPSFLHKMTALLRQPDNRRYIGAICYTDQVTELLENGAIRQLSQRSRVTYPPVLMLISMLTPDFHPPPISQLMRHAAIKVAGPMNTELPVMYDFEWTIRLLCHADVITLADTLAFYHFRCSDDETIGAARNSVHEFEHRYAQLRILLQNQLLRDELSHGRMGLGFATNLVHMHHELRARLSAGLSDPIIAYLAQRARRHDRKRKLRRQLEAPLRYLREKWLRG
jgi:Predicted glycosyltransferases